MVSLESFVLRSAYRPMDCVRFVWRWMNRLFQPLLRVTRPNRNFGRSRQGNHSAIQLSTHYARNSSELLYQTTNQADLAQFSKRAFSGPPRPGPGWRIVRGCINQRFGRICPLQVWVKSDRRLIYHRGSLNHLIAFLTMRNRHNRCSRFLPKIPSPAGTIPPPTTLPPG